MDGMEGAYAIVVTENNTFVPQRGPRPSTCAENIFCSIMLGFVIMAVFGPLLIIRACRKSRL